MAALTEKEYGFINLSGRCVPVITGLLGVFGKGAGPFRQLSEHSDVTTGAKVAGS